MKTTFTLLTLAFLVLASPAKAQTATAQKELARAKNLQSQGATLFRNRNHVEGLAKTKEALALYLQHRGTNHQDTARCANIIGLILKNMNRPEEALKHYELVGAIRRHLNPKGNAADRIIQHTIDKLKTEVAKKKPGYAEIAKLEQTIKDLGRQLKRTEMHDTQLLSLELHNRLLGTNHYSTLRLQQRLTISLMFSRRLDEALDLARRSLAAHQSRIGASEFDLANSVRDLGRVYGRLGKLEEAEEYLREAIRVYQSADRTSPLVLGQLYKSIGDFYARDAKAPEKAIPELKLALKLTEQYKGPDNILVRDYVHQLGHTYAYDLKQMDKALPYLLRDLKFAEQSRGPLSPTVDTKVHELASLYRTIDKNRTEELRWLQRGLDLALKTKGTHADHTFNTRALIADANKALGRPAEAKRLLTEAITIRLQKPNEEPRAAIKAVREIAGNSHRIWSNGRPAAIDLLTAVREFATDRLGENHPETVACGTGLLRLHAKEGHTAKVRAGLVELAKTTNNDREADLKLSQKIFDMTASVIWEHGNHKLGDELLQKSLNLRERHLGTTDATLFENLIRLAECRHATGRSDEAAKLIERAIQCRTQLVASKPLQAASTLRGAGNRMLQQGRYLIARPLIQRALTVQQKTKGPDHANTLIFLHTAVRINTLTGNYDEALRLVQTRLGDQDQGPRTRTPEGRRQPRSNGGNP